MTSPRTTSPEPKGPAGGFTLVELLLVLSLVVLLAALATPALTGTLARVRLDAAAEQVRTAWADARLEAMRTGSPVAFQCRLETSEYTLSKLEDATAALQGSTETADQVRLADDEHDDLGDVTFVRLTTGDPADPAVDPNVGACVVFYPDGLTDDAVAVIQSASGQQRRIELRSLTGAATVSEASSDEAFAP